MSLRQWGLNFFSKYGGTLVWLLGLAMLSVGARNFEPGLSLDAPIYAKIALYLSEAIRQGGDWILLDAGTPAFIPFTEHTHGGFWLQALLFLILPAEDWVARIPGHLFYLGSLFLIYTVARQRLGESAAVWSILVLISWPTFSNFHSTFYLDPGVLFFGMLFLWAYDGALENSTKLSRRRAVTWAVLAGLSLAASFLFKGMTVLVFGLPAAVLGGRAIVRSRSLHKTLQSKLWIVSSTVLLLLVFATCFGLYWRLIQNSAVPDFLERYWNGQFGNRFARKVSWGFFFNFDYWKRLASDTHYLLLLLPLVFLRGRSTPFQYFLLFCILSVSLAYTYTFRIGGQYWLLVMPPLAILLGSLLSSTFSLQPEKLKRWSLIGAVALVCLVQYLPFSTHNARMPEESELVAYYSNHHQIPDLVLSLPRDRREFLFAASFSWYGEVKVLYGNPQAFSRGELSFTNTFEDQPMTYKGPKGEELDYNFSDKFMLLDFVGRVDAPCSKRLIAEGGKVHEMLLAREFPNAAFYVPSSFVEQVPFRCARTF